MQKKFYVVLAFSVILALAAGCGGGGSGGGGNTGGVTSGGAGGDAGRGEQLFAEAVIREKPGCRTCHSIDGSQLVGPTLQGIASRAGTRVSGESAEQYLHQSIVNPNAYVVEGFAQGVMPAFDNLSEQQVNDLVAYLMTLK